jgi:acetyltransferase-like isoleucine patch superfamily enzyme
VGLLGCAHRALARRLGYVWGPRLASALRKRWILLRNPQAEIRFGRDVRLGPGFSLHMPGGGTFIAGDGVEFRRGFRAEVMRPEGRIVIGAESVLTYDVLIQCSTSIEIGAQCGLGQSTIVVDGNHRFRDLTKPPLAQGWEFRPIRIDDGAVLMSKCTVMADVGERAMVGANSVVSRPIPPFSVAMGSPAEVRDYFGPEERQPVPERGA